MKRTLLQKILRVLAAIFLIIAGIIVYIQLTYERSFAETPFPKITASKDPAVIEHGEYIVNAVSHCSSCHGPAELASQNKINESNLQDLRGGYVIKAGPFGTFYPGNLTPDDTTGIGKLSDGQVARVIRHGVSPGGRLDPLMTFSVGPMSDEDLTAVISYLRSIPPIKNETKPDQWGFIAKALSGRFNQTSGELLAPYVAADKAKGPSVERGAYLANGPAFCHGCHSPINYSKGGEVEGAYFSGGRSADTDQTDPAFEIIPPNITSDAETSIMTSFPTEDAFVDRFKKTKRVLAGSRMPWDNFARMTEDDLRSIFRYLKTVPPVKHAVGPSRRPKKK